MAASKCESSPMYQGLTICLVILLHSAAEVAYIALPRIPHCACTFPMGFKYHIYVSFCLDVLDRQIPNYKIP